MAKESAEEKLLKMMQKKGVSVAAKSSTTPASGAKQFKFTFSIHTLNVLLFLGIFVCIMAVVFELRSGYALLTSEVSFSGDGRQSIPLSEMMQPSVRKVDYYLKKVNERNIFKPYAPKAAAKALAEGLKQDMSQYKMVGISWLDLPETASVMIENAKTHETVFLKQGEKLGGVTVKAIYTDRAVFSHENEEMTIKL
ncbi:MAG: hypothetical protein HQL13_03445 [Candidatus Omnitrophica bacterium]|nr:hypothetical protein [Candidatus Omnitrophota bacterium]